MPLCIRSDITKKNQFLTSKSEWSTLGMVKLVYCKKPQVTWEPAIIFVIVLFYFLIAGFKLALGNARIGWLLSVGIGQVQVRFYLSVKTKAKLLFNLNLQTITDDLLNQSL